MSALLDTIPPALAITTIEGDDATINAAEAAGGITVSGTAEIGATLTVNGSAVSVAPDGTWSTTLISSGQRRPAGHGHGRRPSAGNTRQPPTHYTIDTTAPTVQITSATGRPIGVETAPAPGEAGTVVSLYLDGSTTAAVTATVLGDGSWSATISLGADGSHTVIAKDSDAAGNIGAVSASYLACPPTELPSSLRTAAGLPSASPSRRTRWP